MAQDNSPFDEFFVELDWSKPDEIVWEDWWLKQHGQVDTTRLSLQDYIMLTNSVLKEYNAIIFRDENSIILRVQANTSARVENTIAYYGFSIGTRRISKVFKDNFGVMDEEERVYLLRYLAQHLFDGQSYLELDELINYEWLCVKQDFDGGYYGFMNDVELAWQAVRKSLHPAAYHPQLAAFATEYKRLSDERVWQAAELELISRQIRYAIIQSSINSIPANAPPHLFPLLVEAGIWTISEAVSFATRLLDVEKRFFSLLALVAVDILPSEGKEGQLRAVWDTLLEIISGTQDERLISSFISRSTLYAPDNVSEMLIERAQAIKSERVEYRESSDQLSNVSYEDSTVIASEATTDSEIIDLLLKQFRDLKEQPKHTETYSLAKKVIPHLPAEFLEEVVEFAQSFRSNQATVLLLIFLGINPSFVENPETFRGVLSEYGVLKTNIVRTFRRKGIIGLDKLFKKSQIRYIISTVTEIARRSRDKTSLVLAAIFNKDFQEEALDIMISTGDPYALTRMIRHIKPELLEKVLEVIPKYYSDSESAGFYLMDELIIHLNVSQINELLTVVEKVPSRNKRIALRTRAATYLPFDERKHLVKDIYREMSYIDDQEFRIEVTNDLLHQSKTSILSRLNMSSYREKGDWTFYPTMAILRAHYSTLYGSSDNKHKYKNFENKALSLEEIQSALKGDSLPKKFRWRWRAVGNLTYRIVHLSQADVIKLFKLLMKNDETKTNRVYAHHPFLSYAIDNNAKWLPDKLRMTLANYIIDILAEAEKSKHIDKRPPYCSYFCALADIGAFLPPEDILEILARISSRLSSDYSLVGIAALIPFIPKDSQERIQEKGFSTNWRSRLFKPFWRKMNKLKPHEYDFTISLLILERVSDNYLRSWGYLGLLPYTRASRETFDDLLYKSFQVPTNVSWTPVEQYALLRLARFAPEKYFKQIINIIDADDNLEAVRIEILLTLVVRLLHSSPITTHRIFNELLPLFANRSRVEFLSHLAIFGPVLELLGGVDALQSAARDVFEIGTWWK